MKIKCILLLFICISTCTIAQNQLKGRVMDAYHQNYLENVSLRLIHNKLSLLSDSSGTFLFSKLNNGLPDTLIVSMIGYKKRYIPIHENKVVEIQLTLDKPNALAEVKVKASVPMSEDFVNQKINFLDIVMNASSKADPLLAVQSTSAASPFGESASISFRGSNPQLTQIYLNDIPIPEPIKFTQMSSLGTFSLIPINSIKDLLIFPSNPPLELLNASTGVVQIQSNETFINKNTEIDVSLGQAGIHWTPWAKEKNGINLFGHHQFSPLLKFFNPTSLQDLPQFTESDWGINAYFQSKNLWRFKIFSLFMVEKYSSQFRHPSFVGPFEYQKNRHMQTFHISKLQEHTQWTFKLGFHESSQHDSTGNFSYQPHSFQLFSGIDLQFFPRENWTIKTGYQWFQSQTSYQIRKPMYSFDYRPQSPVIQYSNTPRFSQQELFLTNNYTLAKPIRIGFGVKLTHFPELYNWHFTHQIHTRWYLNEAEKFLNVAWSKQIASFYTPENEYSFVKSQQISIDLVQEKELQKWSLHTFYKIEKSILYSLEAFGAECNFSFVKSKSKHEWSIGSHWSQLKNGNITQHSPYQIPYFFRTNSQWKWKFIDLSLSSILRMGNYYRPLLSSTFSPDLQVYVPQFDSLPSRNLSAYMRIDAMLSKMIHKTNKLSWITYLSISNVLNRDNVKSINYSWDYQQPFQEYFQKRIIYVGVQMRW